MLPFILYLGTFLNEEFVGILLSLCLVRSTPDDLGFSLACPRRPLLLRPYGPGGHARDTLGLIRMSLWTLQKNSHDRSMQPEDGPGLPKGGQWSRVRA